MSQEPLSPERLRTRLLEKASAGNAFRQRLLDNPKARAQPGGTQELPNQALEKLAGGVDPIPLPRSAPDFEKLSKLFSGNRFTSLKTRFRGFGGPIL